MKQADWTLEEGSGRTKVSLAAWRAAKDLLVYLYNQNIHIGAVAVAGYNREEKRAFSSVVTMPGHRDDEVAKKQAHILARHTKGTVSVIAGIHVDNITLKEIAEVTANADKVVQALIKALPHRS